MCLADIRMLQLALNPEQFELASVAMIAKWQQEWPDSDFPARFRHQWLTKNHAWFEGFDADSPATNNGRASFNGVIKMYTFRERLPVGQFLTFSEKMVREWSLDTTDRRPFQRSPVVSTKEYKDAWEYMQQGKTPSALDDGVTWFLPAGTKMSLTEADLTSYLNNVEAPASFDLYVQARQAVWVVKTDGELPSCTCPVGIKRGVCKHTLTVGVWTGAIAIPDVAKHATIGQKRKRGRPAATTPALVQQR